MATAYAGDVYEKNLSTGVVTKYYSFGGRRVAMKQGGTLRYLLGDHLGSTSVVLDTAGTVVGRQNYYPYGRIRSSTGPGFPHTDKLFTGHQKEGDLYYMKARFYDPLIGRFISADAIVPDPSNPQSMNRYSYVRGNPMRYTDPTGHHDDAQVKCLLGCGGTPENPNRSTPVEETRTPGPCALAPASNACAVLVCQQDPTRCASSSTVTPIRAPSPPPPPVKTPPAPFNSCFANVTVYGILYLVPGSENGIDKPFEFKAEASRSRSDEWRVRGDFGDHLGWIIQNFTVNGTPMTLEGPQTFEYTTTVASQSTVTIGAYAEQQIFHLGTNVQLTATFDFNNRNYPTTMVDGEVSGTLSRLLALQTSGHCE